VAQISFTEVTGQTFGSEWLGADGRSIAWGDYDNDGWPDLFVAENFGFSLALYHNEGDGRFTDRAAVLQPGLPLGNWGGGATFGDYDNDGDLDIYVPVGAFVSAWRGRNPLLRNEGKQFQEVGLEAGLTDSLPTDNVVWLDYDRDGHIDLYTGNLSCAPADPAVRNKLYRNQGDGTFRDVTAEVGLDVQIVHSAGEFDCAGGSNGGMAAGDFNGDGWPDLYVGAFRDRNRLFLSDGKGGFQDATTNEIGDPGEAYGVAVGDIDNDGDLEIFQGAGGSNTGQQRSLMLLNLGQGQFLDVTEGVGLSALRGEDVNPTLADIDNDGDLDLLTDGFPAYFFRNNGDITFTELSSLTGTFNEHALGDFDLDGFLDLAGEGFFHTRDNGNHYLRVEAVGVKSNRDGLGARLFATSGELKQMREIGGSTGFYQHERAAHFGLGQHSKVDRLEIRWPSGQVDVLEGIPVDQKIRVIEGQQQYHPIQPVTWAHNLPDSAVSGAALQLEATVRPALFEASARIVQVSADLSGIGGPAEILLSKQGDGAYNLETSTVVNASGGPKDLWIEVEQQTAAGSYRTYLAKTIAVLPAIWLSEDLRIFVDGVTEGWKAASGPNVDLALQEESVVYEGRSAIALQGEGPRRPLISWEVRFQPAAPVDIGGYASLRLAFHPGEAVFPDFVFDGTPAPYIMVFANDNNPQVARLVGGWNSPPFDLVRREVKDWQVVEIPLRDLGLRGPLKELRLGWNVEGRFYIDDLRLVAATPPPATLVEENHTSSLPSSFSLSQNFPNPFNSETVILFALPERGEVELAVYNLAGQQVAKLVEGAREAGSYAVRWDGRDECGRELASGIYLYRLRAGKRMETRKLVLVR
jgi:hypothetical protein